MFHRAFELGLIRSTLYICITTVQVLNKIWLFLHDQEAKQAFDDSEKR